MNTTGTIAAPATRRSPNGCNRPVMTHLAENERVKLERIADIEMRSLSATVRMLLLRGIEQYEAASTSPTEPDPSET